MKKRFPLFFLPVMLILCFLPCLARAQPQSPQQIQPPQLLTPENGSTLKGSPEFFWTSAVLPRGFKALYKLKVVAVSQGQSAVTAVGANQPVHETSIRRTQESWPANGPSLKVGQTYAWCVQVVDVNGNPVGENQGLSDVSVFTYEAGPEGMQTASSIPVIIDMDPLVMTGSIGDENTTPIVINMAPLVMTGLLGEEGTTPVVIDMDPLIMTGILGEETITPIVIDMDPLVITGILGEETTTPVIIDMDPLVMTGLLGEEGTTPIVIDMDPLVMTGIESGQPKPPVEENKTPSTSKFQEDLKNKLELKKAGTDGGGKASSQPPDVKEARQKLDLPSKKQGTVDGANPPAGQPDAAQMKQGGTGKITDDTGKNKTVDKTPSLKTPTTPEKQGGDAEKPLLNKKIEPNKTIDDAVKERKTDPLLQPAGTK